MLKEELKSLIEKEQDVIPFLRTLTPKDKRELVPFLKKYQDTLFERRDIVEKTRHGRSYSSQPIHSQKKRDLITKVCFVCFNKTDIKKAFWNIASEGISDEYLETIISWYVPKWYSDLINEQAPWGLNYQRVMKLYKMGVLEPSTELIVQKLPHCLIEQIDNDQKRTSFYRPQRLLEYTETLETHIWLLFEQVSSINNYYAYNHLENYKDGNDIWIHTIGNLIEQGSIDRKKTLIATLHTATKGFNKTLSGWFSDLLIALNPTPQEIIKLQDDFFVGIHSPHSKVVNTALRYFKKVANDPKFQQDSFIQNASVLLNSDTKSIVNSSLMILEKIAKTAKKKRAEVCVAASEAFISQDEKIQLRAAKVIQKYGTEAGTEIGESLEPYISSLFHEPKLLLTDFLPEEESLEEDELLDEKISIISPENEIENLQTIDELIFFVSQVLDNNEVYHLDLFLTHIVKLSSQLTSKDVLKLEPLLKRAFDLSVNEHGWNSRLGLLEYEISFFLNDFGTLLIQRYPGKLANFSSYKKKKKAELWESSYNRKWLKAKSLPIEKQSIPDYIYQPHHTLFLKAKQLINDQLELPLLSTPTHTPCWIDPLIFVERVLAYTASKQPYDFYDMQLALSRLSLDYYDSQLEAALDRLEPKEVRDGLLYLYGFQPFDKEKVTQRNLWLILVLTRQDVQDLEEFSLLTGSKLQREQALYAWECSERPFHYKVYDYQRRKHVPKVEMQRRLRLLDFDQDGEESSSVLSEIKGLFKKKQPKLSSFYDYMKLKKQTYFTLIQPHDDVKFLLLAPNNPDPFLSQVVRYTLYSSTFTDETSKKNMGHLLKGLHEIWVRKNYGDMTYLFLAASLLCSDKVARELASEIWVKATSEANMDQHLLGSLLGKLQFGEYAPLKRFTDLLTEILFNVSSTHNQALCLLLDSMLSRMHKDPIRGLKKLLEIYLELSRKLTNYRPSESFLTKTSEWKNVKTVAAVCKKFSD